MKITVVPHSKLKYGGRKVGVAKVTKKNMSYQDAVKVAQDLSTEYAKHKNGYVSVALKYNLGWRSGNQTSLGSPVNVFSFEGYDDNAKYDQDTFDEMHVYFFPTGNKVGGTDVYNDCLWRALRDARNGIERLPKSIRAPEDLKRLLKIGRSDPVPLEKIPLTETICQFNINVQGEHTYISKNKYRQSVTIELINEHYQVPKSQYKQKTLTNGYNFHRCKLYVYSMIHDNVKLYDGKTMIQMNQRDLKLKKKEEKYKSIFVHTDEDLKTFYDGYVADAKTLLKESSNLIDLFKSQHVRDHVRSLFNLKSCNTISPEPLTQLECDFLKTSAALMYCEAGTYENAIKYDINSMYPYCLTKICFPVKEGEFKYLKELPEKLEYGQYRVEIEESSETRKLFRWNKDNKYTHYDIQAAKLLNLKVKLIVDDQPNALIYTKDKLEYGAKLFKPTVDFLYELKLKGVPYANKMLRTLWGSLCEKNVNHKTIYEDDEEFDITANARITGVYPIGNATRVEYCLHDSYYATPYARIGPFVTSYARMFMAKLIFPHIKDIIHIHTDGFITTKEIPNMRISKELGDWKIEKQGEAVITKINKPVQWT